MHGKFTENALPTVAAIQVEAARIETMILAAVQREESSHLSSSEFMQLQMCRAEMQAYLAGLLFSLGHTNLLNSSRHIVPELTSQETEPRSIESTPVAAGEEEDFRCIECFEC